MLIPIKIIKMTGQRMLLVRNVTMELSTMDNNVSLMNIQLEMVGILQRPNSLILAMKTVEHVLAIFRDNQF